MFKHILIPTDGSKTAQKAIHAGVALAKDMGARVTGFHAEEPLPARLYGEGYMADRKLLEEFKKRASEHAQRCVNEVMAAAAEAGVECDSIVVQSSTPYRSIVETAERGGCDAIFIASHGYRGLERLVIGSVTQEVLLHTRLPVLVFR